MGELRPGPRLRMPPWPFPALLCWALLWLMHRLLLAAGLPPVATLLLATAVGGLASLWGRSWWRRLILAGGFPLALLVSGAVAVPPWAWLVLLVLLALIYPLQAWRDAPLFPTPADALQALPAHAPLVDGAGVLDAGCGLGHGLAALRTAYPQAQLHGIEWSWPLRLLCAWRCPWARVRQGDIWRADWAPYALIYLFQRPESMPRAAEKAAAQMRAGSWLVSLEFEVREWVASHVIHLADGRPVWLYQAPFIKAPATASGPPGQGRNRTVRR